MRFRDLQEDESFADFGQQAADAVGSITKRAGAAFNKFKGSYEKAKGEVESEQEKAAKDAERAAQKAGKDAEKAKGKKKKKDKSGKPAMSIPELVAKVVLDRTPDPEDLPEFDKLGAEDFMEVTAAIEKARERLAKFPREMRKALNASDFLQDQHKSNDELNDMLAEQPEKGEEAAEDMLLKNLYDEQSVWTDVMTTDDGTAVAQEMVGLIKAISRDFEKRNLAATGSGGKKSFPEGTGIVRIMSTQRQLIAMKLGLLDTAVEQLSHKPVTEASLRRVRKLLERMGEPRA